ncbi:MAG: ABC transporter permease [Candidatus Gastranaerophilales bacterium]|nr:ABC transporter permease [Candidatus Gastranaerophilales bacterium]
MFQMNRTLTYKAIILSWLEIKEFLITLGNIGQDFSNVLKYLLTFKIKTKEVIEQGKRFAYDSLPISLTIVGMTSAIIAMQLAPELAKQGAGDYTGMLSSLVMIRELAVVMSGFAIISMVGSSFASEIASMSVTEQISAMKVLGVDPIEYLIVPRFIAGFIFMPVIFVISALFGLVCAGLVSNWTADLSILNYITSLWHGLYIRDIFIAILKSSFFGATIALISCSCGYAARGGAKEVGLATTKAVVWSFVAIAIWDFVFASVFYL